MSQQSVTDRFIVEARDESRNRAGSDLENGWWKLSSSILPSGRPFPACDGLARANSPRDALLIVVVRSSCRNGQSSATGEYLVDADNLRSAYREIFLKGLDQLHAKGELKLEGEFAHLNREEQWQVFLNSLRSVTWVSYIEPPPSDNVNGKTVVKYLARYLTGGPISDRRIVSADETRITFLAREGTKTGGERK